MQNKMRALRSFIKNGGLSDARNVAIDVAKGEYITFVDSDDYVANDYVESLYKLILENDAQMSITRCIPFLKERNRYI